MEGGKAVLIILFLIGLIYGLIWAKNKEKTNRFAINNIEIVKTWNLV
jgi:hypothetical protein